VYQEEDPFEGFLVAKSDSFALLQLFNRDVFLDGYAAIRIADIEMFSLIGEGGSFFPLTVPFLHERPRDPRIALSDVGAILRSLRMAPLVAISRRKQHSGFDVGETVEVGERSIRIREFSRAARRAGIREIRFRMISSILFDLRYLHLLQLVRRSRQVGIATVQQEVASGKWLAKNRWFSTVNG
jgi:hypothetical protein